MDDNNISFDKPTVSEKFNVFYTTVASKLVKNCLNVSVDMEGTLFLIFIQRKVLF